MERFPKMVYRFPARLPDATHLQDGAYDSKVVADEAEHDNALEDGWSETPADARDAHQRVQDESQRETPVDEALAEAGAKAADTSDDGAPAKRAELEQKAKEIGVEFSSRIGDAKLAERIAVKLAELGA